MYSLVINKFIKGDFKRRTTYIGCTKDSFETILHFQIIHKTDLNVANKKEVYYLFCKQSYVKNISTIIRDIN